MPLLDRRALFDAMATANPDQLPVEYQEWVDSAIRFADVAGEPGLVLLVGSRGAGYADSWSDLDLWILGDKATLDADHRREYDTEGQLFRDRGDHGAHSTFYDWRDSLDRLDACEPVFTWIATRSACLHGPTACHRQLQETYATLPHDRAESLLRAALGAYMIDSGGGIAKTARGDVTGGVAAAGRAIDAVARVCILADHQPYPYGKWLLRAARESRLGPAVSPVLDLVASSMAELTQHPVGTSFRDWTPISELRRLRPILSDELARAGWQGPWVTDLALCLPLAFRG